MIGKKCLNTFVQLSLTFLLLASSTKTGVVKYQDDLPSSTIYVSSAYGVNKPNCGKSTSMCKTIQYALRDVTSNDGLVKLMLDGGDSTQLTYYLTESIKMKTAIVLEKTPYSRYQPVVTQLEGQMVFPGFANTEDQENIKLNVKSITFKNINLVSIKTGSKCKDIELKIEHCHFNIDSEDDFSAVVKIEDTNKKSTSIKIHIFQSKIINSRTSQSTYALHISAHSLTRLNFSITESSFVKSAIRIIVSKPSYSTNQWVSLKHCYISGSTLHAVSIRGITRVNITQCRLERLTLQSISNFQIHQTQFSKDQNVKISGSGATIQNSKGQIYSSSFTGYNSEKNGGGLTLIESKADITDTTFTRNIADGGAILLRNSVLLVINGRFIDNKGKKYGGGILSLNSNVTIMASQFFDNVAPQNGGGVLAKHSRLSVAYCDFSRNTAIDGASVYVWNSNATVTKSNFYNNKAIGNGAAFLIRNHSFVNIFHSKIYNNEATHGTGVAIYKYNQVQISYVTFKNNHAEKTGGTMRIVHSNKVAIINSQFLNNDALLHGGAIRQRDRNNVKIINCTFTGNVAKEGGGIHSSKVDTITIKATVFRRNKAELHGGGMYVRNSSRITLKKCRFILNSAAELGGGIALKAVSTSSIISSKFIKNTAKFGGGISATRSHVTISSTKFTENKAKGQHAKDKSSNNVYNNKDSIISYLNTKS